MARSRRASTLPQPQSTTSIEPDRSRMESKRHASQDVSALRLGQRRPPHSRSPDRSLIGCPPPARCREAWTIEQSLQRDVLLETQILKKERDGDILCS